MKPSDLGNYLSIKELIISSAGTMMITVNTSVGDQIYVCGNNTYGTFLNGNTTNQSTPILFNTKQFGDDVFIKKLSLSIGYRIGNNLSAYIILGTDSGADKIYVWGQNNLGQLGLGNQNNQLSPVLFDTTQFGTYDLLQEFVISDTSYAVVVDGKSNSFRYYAWGNNDLGQAGVNSSIVTLTIPTIGMNLGSARLKFVKMFDKTTFVCITNGGGDTLSAAGDNSKDQTGTGLSDKIIINLQPVMIPRGAEIKDVNSNWSTYIQVKENGLLRVYVCGFNVNGELGLGDFVSKSVPVLLDNSRLGNFTEIYDSSFDSSRFCLTGGSFAYVKTPTGDKLYVWGWNGFGQLGIGNSISQQTPVLVNSLNLSTAKIKSFGQNINWSSFITLDRNGQSESYASGYNGYGQLANGDINNGVTSFTPILPTRYTNPQPKVIPTPNLTSSEALQLINPNNVVDKTILDQYVDITSFPAGATLSIDPATTTSDYKNGILNLGIRTNQYNDLLIVNTALTPKTFNVTIPGFRPVTDVNTNPVSVIIRDADGNNIDKIYDQLVDSTYKVINRDLLEYYFDLSSIPPNAVIHLYRTSFGNDTEATFTLTASQVYGNNGLIVSNQLYVKTDLVWTFTSSQLNLALVISLSVVGGLLLIGAIIAIMLVRRSSNRLII